MNSIKEYQFSDLYEMSSGISSKPEQAGHGAPFVSFSTVFNNYFIPESLPDLMDTSEDEQEIYSVKTGDILLTRTSETIDELGMSCVALKDYPEATYSGFVKRLRPTQTNVTYAKYMGFYLRSKFFRKTMTNNAVLTLRASLNEEIFSYLKLYLPDFETQRRIGDFLYSLESKMILNNRINAELEAMAKTIYEYWFVQFDFPNKNGKPYKASGGKMVWSEELKREIPDVWEVGTLLDIADFANGIACQKFRPKEGELFYKVIKIREMGEGRFLDSSEFVSKNIPNKVVINSGDILFSWSATLDVKIWSGGTGALNQHIFKVTSSKYPRSYFYFEVLRYLQHFKMIAELRKTTMGHITQDHLKQSRVAIPPLDLIEAMHKVIDPILNKIVVGNEENQKLTELRDWLLPMLMNGQIKIKDAESLSATALAKDEELAMAAEAEVIYGKRQKK